ncbi:hypothetical protein OX283_014125 [Flavobacterium sp. SUN052]|uniref:DUF7935 family protein n=1 Tax=Flavobacterium sp. SUN052 TaxID=3002441 RepID=UPI00237E3757|nr:hypothetical protein [Flavobacterium sp. SUN052]MEC4005804.1 hypothetical protein [Flavobacterium sp. SUN052]
MNTDKLIELAFYTLPALITGAVAYYSFQTFSKSEQSRRKFQLLKENQKQALPLRLQAYERLALFLERINPSKLLVRIAPLNNDKMDYSNLLIFHIEQEYEHNLTQQIYVSDECWTMILTAKNSIIQNIRKTAIEVDVENSDKLRQTILSNLFDSESASNLALGYLKNEVKEFL